jgi:enoyl-CoA hydratase/carnithine racemase
MSESRAVPDWSGHIESEAVDVERHEGGVAVLTLRSEPLGVLRQAVKRAIRAALLELEADAGVRTIVLTGNGRAFSVGSDVREFERDADWLAAAALVDQGIGFTIEESRLPVIAALNGLTLGGGLEMALACDMRLCAASARLGLPEVVVGAFASGGGTQRLPRVVGPGRALDLLLTGRIIDAQEALAIGLVERVVVDDELIASALEIGRSIAAMPVAGIAASKRTLQAGLHHGVAEGYRLERELTVTVGMTDDAVEGQAAFIEKRPPLFGTGEDWVRMEMARRSRENETAGA